MHAHLHVPAAEQHDLSNHGIVRHLRCSLPSDRAQSHACIRNNSPLCQDEHMQQKQSVTAAFLHHQDQKQELLLSHTIMATVRNRALRLSGSSLRPARAAQVVCMRTHAVKTRQAA